MRRWRGREFDFRSIPNLKFNVRYNKAISYDQIRKTLAPVGDPDPPPGKAAEEHRIDSRETINTKNRIQNSTCIGRSKRIPCWNLCLAPTGITRTRLFSVDCGRYRQSGPRPEPRLLRQAALEALTNSARTYSPRRIGRNEFRRLEAEAAAAATAAACVERRGGGGQVLGLGLIKCVRLSHNPILNRIGDGLGSGPTGPGPTDEHSFHLHHRDFTVTPITDQIGPIDSVSETE
ncbi:hypothetical protein F511_19774 [Dorcoceras hygrometricum]|uniref:Uncharacterized protein n=1 Tax=Dorcoceras hygrometricum TaxID=472368 RepID=A0A2Z7BRX0_9LAMI|nr:hypothetical protein F511_19774 [Dorcoceras hygrometricum]